MSTIEADAERASMPTSPSDFPVTVFASLNNPHGERTTLRELVEDLRVPFPGKKDDAPLWSPATFKGDHRTAATVEHAFAIGFDVDAAPVPSADELRAAVAKYRGFFHASASHTAASPRWRLILVCSRPVTADEYRRLWRALEGSLGFAIGQEAKDPSRAWYVPTEPVDGSAYVFHELTGEPVDVDAVLVNAATVPPPVPSSSGVTLSSAASSEKRSAAATVLGVAWPPLKKGRHVAQRALAGALCRDDWSEDEAVEFLCDVCRIAGDEDRPKREKTVRDTYRRAADGKTYDGWSTLESFVPKSIVNAARDLLQPFGTVTLKRTKEDAAEATKDEGLGFEFGAWSALPPPLEFLVEGLFPRGCVGMLYGHADSLKTWILFSLGIAVANGAPWLGRYATKKGRVGLVDFETGKSNVARRLHMLGAGASSNLGAKSFAALKPNDPAFWEALEHEKFDLVIVDSLRRANPGANENDSAEAIVPLELAAEFSERTGCAVIFIHHAKKTNDEGWPEHRGSAAIKDQVDCSFVVKKESDESALVKRVHVKCEKPGDMRTPDPFSVEVEFNDVACKARVRLADDRPSTQSGATDLRTSIRLAVERQDYSSLEKLAKAVRTTKATVGAEVTDMLGKRELVKLDGVYRIDTLEKARARIVAEVRKRPKTSIAGIASGATVADWQVRTALDDGVITETSKGWFGVPDIGSGRCVHNA